MVDHLEEGEEVVGKMDNMPQAYYLGLEIDLVDSYQSVEGNLDLQQQEDFGRFIDVGEYGLAFEYLCSCLLGKSITSAAYAKLSELGIRMNIDDNVWKPLESGVNI